MDAMIPNKMFVCFFFKLPFLGYFMVSLDVLTFVTWWFIVPKIERIDKTWTTWIHIVSHSVYLYWCILMQYYMDLESHHVALFHSRQTNAPTFAVLNRGPSWSDNKIRSRGTHLIVWLIWKSYCCYCFKIRGCLVSRDINVQCNK